MVKDIDVFVFVLPVVKLAIPFDPVFPETLPVYAPLQMPYTVTPSTGFPEEFFTRTLAVASHFALPTYWAVIAMFARWIVDSWTVTQLVLM